MIFTKPDFQGANMVQVFDMKKVLTRCDPWDAWLRRPTRALVKQAIDNCQFEKKPFSGLILRGGFAAHDIYNHVHRIAYLVKMGWDAPVCFDVGVWAGPDDFTITITDGNHRMCAADYRDDSTILGYADGRCENVDFLLAPPRDYRTY